MCFEFEALYWAKLAEEEEKRNVAEKQRKAVEGCGSEAGKAAANPQKQPACDEEPLPA